MAAERTHGHIRLAAEAAWVASDNGLGPHVVVRACLIDGGHLLGCELDAEHLNVGLEVLDLVPADEGDAVLVLLTGPRERDARYGHLHVAGGELVSDALEDFGELDLCIGRLRPAHLLLAESLWALKLATPKHAEGSEGHALVTEHGDDLLLHSAVSKGEPALAACQLTFQALSSQDDELGHAARLGILIAGRHDPGGHIARAEVEHSALAHEVVECAHELGDARAPVPVVHVQDVDVVGLQLAQRRLERHVQAFGAVALEINVDARVDPVHAVVVEPGELGRENNGVAVLAGLHPFPNQALGLLGCVSAAVCLGGLRRAWVVPAFIPCLKLTT